MTDYIIHKDTEDSLTHYGVKGSKWGVRRYQNEDGSYKPGAEGRYYQAVKNAFNTAKSRKTEALGKLGTAVGSKTSGAVPKAIAKTLASKLSGGGGAVKTDDTKPANKTRTGLDIELKDVSTKKAGKVSGSGKGSGGSSSEKKKEEKEKGNEEFKLSQLTDKIDNLFGEMSDEDWEEMELSDAEQDEMDDLITKYNKWRSGNSSKTKQTKKIDAFIERYRAWRSNHGKKAEHSLIYKNGSWTMTDDTLIHWGIPGMKWGVRRYQNPDGTLTAAGKKRYASEVRKNNQKKKENRAKEEDLKDPNLWVSQDISRAKDVATSSRQLTNDLKELEKNTRSKKKPERLDLSDMTDKQLRDKINRELLERQYNDVFNPEEVSRGREVVNDILNIGGSVLAVTASALGVALAIKELKRG